MKASAGQPAHAAAEALVVVTGNTATFENHSRYATSWHWDFGDGTTSDERHNSHIPMPRTAPIPPRSPRRTGATDTSTASR
ncbi:MAG: PKD domain-containing protein [Saprospiraceae bacterium]|nr:PKD domain-containing protein [Saprospiraceae bacterium]